MAAVATPERVIVIPDDYGQHTRPPDPPSPCLLRGTKRNKSGDTLAPIPAQQPANEPRKDLLPSQTEPSTSAIKALEETASSLERQVQIKKQVLMLLAKTLDHFIDGFNKDQPDHRAEARDLVRSVTDFITKRTHAPANSSHRQLPVTNLQAAKTRLTGTSNKPASWADVVGKPSQNSQENPTRNTQATTRLNQSQARQDDRIFARLSEERLLSRPDPYVARTTLARGLATIGITAQDIPDITAIRTGWAIRPASAGVRDKLMAPENRLRVQQLLNAEKVELPVLWYSYALSGIPATFSSYDGNGSVNTAAIIDDEVHIQTGRRPVDCHPSRRGPDLATGMTTWVISFEEPVPPFRLFSGQRRSVLIKKQPKIELHNPGCQGYCNTRRCNRHARCNNCSKSLDNHPEGPCTAPSRCANCRGPFPAGHNGCPARPAIKNGKIQKLTKRELQSVRRTGNFDYTETRTTTTLGASAAQAATDLQLEGWDNLPAAPQTSSTAEELLAQISSEIPRGTAPNFTPSSNDILPTGATRRAKGQAAQRTTALYQKTHDWQTAPLR